MLGGSWQNFVHDQVTPLLSRNMTSDDCRLEDDPYGSRIINQNAIAFLRKHGVEAKTDRIDQLLHSTFVVIDGSLSVIGSHNWTAGSYFKYHDTSIALQNSYFASEMHQWFDAMWKQIV